MKIKVDFVTNSSSQSFVLRGLTTIQALELLAKKFYEEFKFLHTEDHFSKEKVMKFIEDNKFSEINVIFPWTPNYTTFIYKGSHDVMVMISTCQNISWDNTFSQFEVKSNMDTLERVEREVFLDLEDGKIKTGAEFNIEEEKKWKSRVRKLARNLISEEEKWKSQFRKLKQKVSKIRSKKDAQQRRNP